jgi:hypothetical protein
MQLPLKANVPTRNKKAGEGYRKKETRLCGAGIFYGRFHRNAVLVTTPSISRTTNQNSPSFDLAHSVGPLPVSALAIVRSQRTLFNSAALTLSPSAARRGLVCCARQSTRWL